MTRDRDIERIIETWLAPGPTGMPDHLFDSIVDRVERQPQARTARIRQRFHEMPPVLRIAAIAAVLALTFGIGAVVVGGVLDTDPPAPTTQPSPATSASPAPNPSPSPAASGEAALPAELAHPWVGAPRAFASLGTATEALPVLDLDPANTIGGSYVAVTLDLGPAFLISEASVVADGRLRVETAIGDSACTNGDVGEYGYAISADGMILTLDAVSDTCDARAEIYTGTWTRTDCRNDDFLCLGDVPAGTYVSTLLDIRTAAHSLVSERGAHGQLRYTVPAGWANAFDWVNGYDIVPSDAYATADANAHPITWHGIYVEPRVVASAQDDECRNVAEPGIGRTRDALTAWMTGHPGVEVLAPPAAATVGGLPATTFDIGLDPAWTKTCPDVEDGTATAMLVREEGPSTEGWSWSIGAAERQRIILVEIAPDNVMMIAIVDASSPSRFDELVEAATPIVESIEFPE